MIVVNISDIMQDLEDIEVYVESRKKNLAMQHNILYYPLNSCNYEIERYSRTKAKVVTNLRYLMKTTLPLRDKFFSARNENILYLLTESRTSYTINFTIANDGVLKFVNDTDGCCFLQTNGRLMIIYEGRDHSEKANPYIINLLNKQVQSALVDVIKLEVAEFLVVEY